MSGGERVAAAWPRRHPWWSALAAILVLVLVVAALGGFRERPGGLRAAAVGEPVDLGPVELVVTSAEVVSTQADGKEFSDGLPRLLIHGTVRNTTDDPASVSASGDMRARIGDEVLEAASGYDSLRRYPVGMTLEATFSFVLAEGPDAADGVSLSLRQKSFAWNNKLDVGPTWSGGQWHRVVRLSVDDAR